MSDNTSSFEELCTELDKSSELTEEYERQKPYYDLLLSIINAKRALDRVYDNLIEVLE